MLFTKNKFIILTKFWQDETKIKIKFSRNIVKNDLHED